MEDVICINAEYDPDVLFTWKKLGVHYPKLDELVTIREIVKHSTGEVGLRFEQYKNPITLVNYGGIKLMMEQSFHVRRFAHLNGDILTEEEVRIMLEESKSLKKHKEESLFGSN